MVPILLHHYHRSNYSAFSYSSRITNLLDTFLPSFPPSLFISRPIFLGWDSPPCLLARPFHVSNSIYFSTWQITNLFDVAPLPFHATSCTNFIHESLVIYQRQWSVKTLQDVPLIPHHSAPIKETWSGPTSPFSASLGSYFRERPNVRRARLENGQRDSLEWMCGDVGRTRYGHPHC